MGAVTAIIVASDPNKSNKISGMVLDSPFSCFKTMVGDIVRHNVKIPLCLVNGLLSMLTKTIKKKIGVDLLKIRPIELVS